MSRHRHKDSERKLEMTIGTDNFQRWTDKDSQELASHHDCIIVKLFTGLAYVVVDLYHAIY